MEEILLEETTSEHFKSYNDLLQLVQQFQFVVTSTNFTTLHNDDIIIDNNGIDEYQLPNEICIRIAQYLTIKRIQMKDVIAIGCSSIQVPKDSTSSSNINQFVLLSDCLSDDDNETWWMSEETLDVRYQFVDFCCIPLNNHGQDKKDSPVMHEELEGQQTQSFSTTSFKPSRVRIQSITIKIPHSMNALEQFVVQRSDQYYYTFDNAFYHNNNNNNICISPTMDEEKIWETISDIFTLDLSISDCQTFTFDYDVDVKYLRIVCLSTQLACVCDTPNRVCFCSIKFDCVEG